MNDWQLWVYPYPIVKNKKGCKKMTKLESLLEELGYYLCENSNLISNAIKHIKAWIDSGASFSDYVSHEDWKIRHLASKSIKAAIGEPEDPEIGDRITAYRATNRKEEFNDIKSGKKIISKDHSSGRLEKGLSVATDLHYAIRGYKWVYKISGKVIGFGADGEPLLDDYKVIGRIQSADRAIAKDWESGRAAKRSKVYQHLAQKTNLDKNVIIKLANFQ